MRVLIGLLLTVILLAGCGSQVFKPGTSGYKATFTVADNEPGFLAIDTSASTAPGGCVLQYSVDWGDGSDPTDWSIKNDPSHGYDTGGMYTVVLSIRDTKNLVVADTYSQTVTVTDP
jgi:hypothetical protein